MRGLTAVICAFLVLGSVLSMERIQHKCVHDSKFKGMGREVLREYSDEAFKRIMQNAPSASGSVSGGASTGSLSGGVNGGFGTSTDTANVVDGWHQLRITVDYRQSNKFVQSTSSLSSVYQLSIRQVESVRTYFTKFFQVNFTPMLKFGGGKCYNNNIPAFQLPADLFITIYAENDRSTEYFAAATSCYMSGRDGRPVIGAYILNLAFLKATPINEFLYFSTFAHEFTHILGFSNDLFASYVVPGTTNKRGINSVVSSTTISGQRFTVIVLPEVVTYAKSFFGCSSVAGIPLENDGGDGSAGSHWEKTFLPQEYMNPTVENPGIISEFTLNLLRGSGWYKIDTGAAQHYDWGQGSGCGHFQICPTGPGYCSAAQVGASVCASEWNAKATCVQDRSFSSSCNLKRARSHSCLLAGVFQADNTEYYGPGSRCINYASAAGTDAKCHKVNVVSEINLSVLLVSSRFKWDPAP